MNCNSIASLVIIALLVIYICYNVCSSNNNVCSSNSHKSSNSNNCCGQENLNPVPHRSWTSTWRTHSVPIRHSPTRREYPFANPDYILEQSRYKCLDGCRQYKDDETRLECVDHCNKAPEVY